jgi:hypothetical protein
MHFAQVNEFVGAHGQFSVISPIGYEMILKKVRKGAPVRSATEQHTIHELAAQFCSPVLKIPRVYDLIDSKSYIMEHRPPGNYVPSQAYKGHQILIQELVRFYQFMVNSGYYPFGFTILQHPDGTYSLFDFGQFGSVEKDHVKFKHLIKPIHNLLADRIYGILNFLLDIESDVIQTKIEVLMV